MRGPAGRIALFAIDIDRTPILLVRGNDGFAPILCRCRLAYRTVHRGGERRTGKAHRYVQSRPRWRDVLDRDRTCGGGRNALDDGKTEPRSFSFTALAPVEGLEDARQVCLRDTGTGILHAEHRLSADSVNMEVDASAVWGVPQSVIDQVAD